MDSHTGEEDYAKEWIKRIIHPNGGLYDPEDYTSWKPGSRYIVLDGEYTMAMLRAIVEYMSNH